MSARLAAFFKNPFWRRYGNYLAVLAVAVVFGALSVSGVATSATQYLLEKIAIAVILAVSLCMVVGFLGELSLGHF